MKTKFALALVPMLTLQLMYAEAPATAAQTTTTQELNLNVTSVYDPSTLTVREGAPVTLKVLRKDANNCGGELVIPDYGVRKTLPVGKTTEVIFTPKKAGTVNFTCGMGMMKGQIIVQPAATETPKPK